MYQSFDTWAKMVLDNFVFSSSFFLLFLLSQKWKYHGKPEKIHCWVDINLRPVSFKIFLESVQESSACINLPSRPIWCRLTCGLPCISLVSKSELTKQRTITMLDTDSIKINPPGHTIPTYVLNEFLPAHKSCKTKYFWANSYKGC